MEIDMRHAVKNSIKENMHALLECIFVDYANHGRDRNQCPDPHPGFHLPSDG
jgi:hypothetical protein